MLPVNKDLILPPDATTPVPFSCGDGGQQLRDQCYYVNETEATWLGAKAACQERSATLARLDSEEAQTFVNSLLGSDNYWIGLNDRNKEGDFQWLQTSSETAKNSTFWAPGMPRNGSLENCVVAQGALDLQHKGQWSTERCNVSHFFVCQAPAQQDNDTDADGSAERPWGLKCGPFWEDNPNSDYCYLMSSEMLTWQDARDSCLHLGGDLASITSLEEQYFISGLMVNPQTLGAWIGANDLSLEAGWGWIDGSPFAFVNWASGEPNNIGREQDCAAISTGSARWYDLECSLRNGYVCKKRGNVPTTTEKTTVATTVPPGYSVGCPGGWLEYRGVCYWMVREKLSWLEARDQCFKMAAALAAVRDNDHNNFLLSQIPKASCEDVHSNATQCSVWARQGECQVNPIWMSKNCHAACGLCRHVCRDRHTAASCKLWATVGECHRNPDWMHVWCAQSCGVCNEGLSDAVWIGLNSLRVSQSFEWVNGDAVTFTNWILNEPDDNQDSSTCVKMYTGTGRWSDEDCATTSAAGYVCEAPVMQMKETSEPPIKQGCNQTGLGYNHLCYTLVESPAAWQDALADCQSRGGTLASVPDRFVQAFLAAELSVDTELYWLGLADTDNPGTYSWTSGLPLQYTAWAQSHNGTELNTCVAMQTSRPVGLWINANCGQALAYVCETTREGGFTAPTYPPTTLATTPDPGSPSLCQGGWKQFGPMCYTAVSDRQLTWLQARDSCAEMAATLISVHESSLGVFLQDNFNLSSSRNYWIGLSDIGRESVYEWQDGSAFGYSAWASGEPNDLSHRENCVEFIPATARWNDAKCASVRHYFCGRPTGIQPVSTTTTAPPDFGNAICDKEGRWALFDGLCYSATVRADNSVWTWSMAKYWCFKNGGTLASVHSRRQNDFLVSLVQDHPETQFWLGYENTPRIYEDDEDVTWTDGSVLDFMSWGKNEGWDWRSSTECLVLNKNTGLLGADTCSEVAHAFICQKERPDATPTTPPPPLPQVTEGGCPHNLTLMGSKCIAMKEVQHSLSWTRAALLCSSLYTSGRLLTLENPEEFDLLLSVMQNQTKNLWLGMKTVSSERFMWMSDKQMPLTYTKWAKGHPRKAGSLMRCVAMTPSLTWIDMDCDERALPVCQVDRARTLEPSFPVESDPAYPNYTQFGTRFFRLHQSPKTFSAAGAVCQAEGAELASVRSAEEDSFIQRLIFDLQRPVWLGGVQRKNLMRWVNGDSMKYQRSPVEDAAPGILTSCLTQDRRRWSLQPCLQPHPFVCALGPAQVSTAATSTAPQGVCPHGMVQQGSKCYLLEQRNERNWVGAKMECKRRGLTLAVFHQSQQLNDLIDSGQVLLAKPRGYHNVWIGLTQMSEGDWLWADGESLLYSNWEEDSTNSQSALQKCGQMDLSSGRWRARPCFLTKPFLCQTDSSPAATTSPAESTTDVITTVTNPAPTTEEELATTPGADNSSQPNTTYWPGGLPFHPAVEPHPSISKKKAEPLSAGQIVGIIIGLFGLIVIVIVVVILVRTRMNMKGSFYVSPPGGFENALYSKGEETLAIQS